MRILAFISIIFFSFSTHSQEFTNQKVNNWQGVERIVALGDIHGDFDQFTRVLRDSGLINQRNQWIGGKTHFVQTGDVPDRGSETRKIMNLFMALERQAEEAGGMVHPLIGNHEAMNAGGDLRYVTKKEFNEFIDKKSKKSRNDYYSQYVQDIKDNTAQENWPEFDKKYKKKWEDEFPIGWLEHRQNWSKAGLYGRWIASHNAVIIINDTIFMHGGISPKFATTPLDSMNNDIRADVFTYSGIARDPEGPLWYRGLANDEEALLSDHVDQVLAHHKVRRIVVGHSTTNGAIRPRFGARVLMIDIGLGQHYGSNFAYLDITNGEATAIHRGEALKIPTKPGQPYIDYLEKAAALDNELLAQEINENDEIFALFEEAGVTGTFVLYDIQKDSFTGHNKNRAAVRYIPASTFKIANSLVGLSVGAIETVDEILPYGGQPQFLKIWQKDMSLRDAIKISNVPIYQELARRIGLENMREGLRNIGYGNGDIGNIVDRFWLDGPIKISALEQVRFLARLAQRGLPLSEDVQNSVIEILKLEQTDQGTLYGKSGWTTAPDPDIGWWVGWINHGGNIYTFALNIDVNNDADVAKREELTRAALKILKLL